MANTVVMVVIKDPSDPIGVKTLDRMTVDQAISKMGRELVGNLLLEALERVRTAVAK